ncbi:MAG TPA: energy-coupling factor transporter transmembrane component T [Roseiflexaceae bacterium]|nr:energy-coupling factor transporter transmembrane component T [Roseiflexaceae bacterium]
MLSIYAQGTSRIHRLNPLTKLTAALLLIAAAYLLPGLLTPLALFGMLVLLAYAAGVGGPFLWTSLKALLPITFSLFLIQGVLFPPPGATPFRLGPLTFTYEGLAFAFLISSRLLTLSAAMLLLLRTTPPGDLVQSLVEKGLPRSIGYVLLAALQIAPDMSARATAILEAQRSRGLETEGIFRRLRALPALVGPLVVGALVDAEERAMALESRAFTAPGPKTTLRDIPDTPAEHVARTLMLLALAALFIWRAAGAFL